MKFSDFIFNYRSCLSSLIKQQKYFSLFKRLFLLPYKYLISIFRDIFLNKNIDKIDFKNNSLDEYFKYFDCDKSSLVHGYNNFYDDEFKNFQKLKINILEFGIHFGASQAAFSKYFSDSVIIGVDKNPYFKKFFSKNIRSLYCDVSDKYSLHLLGKYLKEDIDIIIDDASHIPDHQLKTFSQMFKILKSKGIYVIEELDIFQSFPESYNKNLDKYVSIPYGKGMENIIQAEEEMISFTDYLEEGKQVMDHLHDITKNKAKKSVKFENGQTMGVDHFTASAITAVHGKVNDENKKKLSAMVHKSPAHLKKAADFAFKAMK